MSTGFGGGALRLAATGRTFGSILAQPGSIHKLSEAEAEVLCGVYDHGKSILVISRELNKSEDLIRKTLKELSL